MVGWQITLIVVSSLIFLILGSSLGVYFILFYNNLKEKRIHESPSDAFLEDEIYGTYRDILTKNLILSSSLDYEGVYIDSYDSKKLFGKLYLKDLTKPIFILFHGYKGGGLRDFNSILLYLLSKNYSCLVVDERGHGLSEGKTISFGIKERYDVLYWSKYINERYPETSIFLYGISMGGASVLMSSDLFLPPNVRGIIADCPFSSFKMIMIETSKRYKIPRVLIEPFVYLGALLFGHFSIYSASSIKSVDATNKPIIIFHGTNDKLVPLKMSEQIVKENDKIKLVKINDAPHAISFVVDKERYIKELEEFIEINNNK